MCEIAVDQHPWGIRAVPDKYVTEDLLIIIAKRACGLLKDNFPERFRNKEFIDRLIAIDSSCKWYLRDYIED